MVGYMDAEALAATTATGEVHFHSRSRGRLWRKGETSGHVLRLVDWAVDCDGDALLVTVDPVGPTCHRDTRSCFDPAGAPAERASAGLRLARDAVGDDRGARRRASGRLVHDLAARRRRRRGRPQGHRGGDRGPPRRQGRRRGRDRRHGPDRRPGSPRRRVGRPAVPPARPARRARHVAGACHRCPAGAASPLSPSARRIARAARLALARARSPAVACRCGRPATPRRSAPERWPRR